MSSAFLHKFMVMNWLFKKCIAVGGHEVATAESESSEYAICVLYYIVSLKYLCTNSGILPLFRTIIKHQPENTKPLFVTDFFLHVTIMIVMQGVWSDMKYEI